MILDAYKNSSTSLRCSFISSLSIVGDSGSLSVSVLENSPVAKSAASFLLAKALFWSYDNVTVHMMKRFIIFQTAKITKFVKSEAQKQKKILVKSNYFVYLCNRKRKARMS